MLAEGSCHVEGRFPPLGHMISEQIGADDLDGAEAMVQDSLKNKLY